MVFISPKDYAYLRANPLSYERIEKAKSEGYTNSQGEAVKYAGTLSRTYDRGGTGWVVVNDFAGSIYIIRHVCLIEDKKAGQVTFVLVEEKSGDFTVSTCPCFTGFVPTLENFCEYGTCSSMAEVDSVCAELLMLISYPEVNGNYQHLALVCNQEKERQSFIYSSY